jgi:hypothetical protein
MVYILHTPAQQSTAERLRADLQHAGYPVEATPSTDRTQAVVALLGGQSETDASFTQGLLRALDSSQHLLPVLIEDVPLPRVIEHLGALDFSEQYDAGAVVQWLSHATAPGARPPMRVLTPQRRARNRLIGAVLAGAVIFWFVTGLILVGVYHIQAPREEYNSIDTLVAVTVDAALDRFRPNSTLDATGFPATVQAVPTAARPPLSQTATAQAAELMGTVLPSLTPSPTAP